MTRNQLLARVHVLKKELGLDDDLYRYALEGLTGIRSSGQLSDSALRAVIADFERRLPAEDPRPAKRKSHFNSKSGRMLQALWISLYNLGAVGDRSDKALMAFVERQTHIKRPEWLRHHDDVEKVAEALKDWLSRDGGVDFRPYRNGRQAIVMPSRRVCEAQWSRLGGWLALPGSLTLRHFAEKTYPEAGDPENWGNAQWGRLSKVLGGHVRSAMKVRAA